VVDGMTLHKAWYGLKPDPSHLRIIGCDAYVHVPKQTQIKLDPHTVKSWLIGYVGTIQYKIWVEGRKGLIVSCDVLFDEDPRGLSTQTVVNVPQIYNEIIVQSPLREAKTPIAIQSGPSQIYTLWMLKQWEDLGDRSDEPTIRVSVHTKKDIGPRHLVDEQGYIAFANIAIMKEVKPWMLSEALNHPLWGE
jgi:hypothetical protein